MITHVSRDVYVDGAERTMWNCRPDIVLISTKYLLFLLQLTSNNGLNAYSRVRSESRGPDEQAVRYKYIDLCYNLWLCDVGVHYKT